MPLGLIWKGDDRGRGEAVLEGGEGLMALIIPVEGHVLLGELVEEAHQPGEVLDKPPVV